MSHNIWFTADTHFNHENCIKYSKRPFKDNENMTEQLIANWNERVRPGDTVYHLGDFAMTWNRGKNSPRAGEDTKKVEAILRRLHGQKHLIKGNHDRKDSYNAKGWAWVGEYKKIRPRKKLTIILFHYCIRSWECIHYGAWHLYGHSHGNLEDDGGGKCMDVGVDCCGYRPIELSEVEQYMEYRPGVYVDHHNPEEAKLHELGGDEEGTGGR